MYNDQQLDEGPATAPLVKPVSISQYCLKCKQHVTIEIEGVERTEGTNRFYAIGKCPICSSKQKRPIKAEIGKLFLEQVEREESESHEE